MVGLLLARDRYLWLQPKVRGTTRVIVIEVARQSDEPLGLIEFWRRGRGEFRVELRRRRSALVWQSLLIYQWSRSVLFSPRIIH